MAPSGTARSTPSTACVSPNDFSSAVVSIASGACVVIGLLTHGPCRPHVYRHRVRRRVIGLHRLFPLSHRPEPRGSTSASHTNSWPSAPDGHEFVGLEAGSGGLELL